MTQLLLKTLFKCNGSLEFFAREFLNRGGNLRGNCKSSAQRKPCIFFNFEWLFITVIFNVIYICSVT